MDYVFLGGAGEVGASCLLVSVADRHILFDCGMRVNQVGEAALPDIELLKQSTPKLDAIFVSHAHADHIGALPLAHIAFPQVPIYATEPTQRISAVMLANAVRLQESDEKEDTNQIFTQDAVDATIAKMHTLQMSEWIDLWDGWRVKMVRSGHILGAVSILLDTPEGSYLYGGDISTFHQKTIHGLAFDEVAGTQPDFMWCEATYGDGNHPARNTEEKKLAEAVATIIENGGSVLIPSFALGRAQEIILILRDAMISKNISVFPVVTDGLVNSICSVYETLTPYLGKKLQKHLENSRQPLFHFRNFRRALMGEQETICKDETPKCIIASSGMLTGGASVTYAKGLAANEKNAIFLSGYQDAESPGRRLQELSQGDTLTFADGTSVAVNCQVERFKLSAHSDQGQLLSVIKQVNPKALALVHGEGNAIAALREKVEKKYPVTCPVNGQVFEETDKTLPFSTETQETLEKTITNAVEVQITDTGVILNKDIIGSHQWKNFINGKHAATLEGGRLIIQKIK
ncbi:MBL fold metallo-hydrolase [Candidatus Poribacteria bacterium]|nr:MBL fold metallo-hydrolase [Candidatus Poribacteria bacterium]